MSNPPQTRGLPRWFLLTVITLVTLVLVAGGALFAYNQLQVATAKPEPEATVVVEAPPVAAPAENADDTAAQSALLYMMGAMNAWIASGSEFDCGFIGFQLGKMRQATPLDSYRGTYEKVIQDSEVVFNLCTEGESPKDLAGSTVTTIESIWRGR